MNYEIHITLVVSNIANFINDCNLIGVKPIIIETENYNGDLGYQVMTSSKHNGSNYFETMQNIVSSLEETYFVLRKKIEIQPEDNLDINHIYFESHFRLKLNKNFNQTNLKNYCINNNFHFSKNIFKKSDDFIWQMITIRNYNKNYFNFLLKLNNAKKWLVENNIIFDKIEIEECIYDSNINVDSNWII